MCERKKENNRKRLTTIAGLYVYADHN